MTADARETRRKVGETRNTHGLWQYNELGKKQRHKNQCNNIDIPHTERRHPQNLLQPQLIPAEACERVPARQACGQPSQAKPAATSGKLISPGSGR